MTMGRRRVADDGIILVLTQEADVTATVVIDKLREDGVPVVRLHTSVYPQHAALQFKLDARGDYTASLTPFDGAGVDLSNVRSVWNRRPDSFSFPTDLTQETFAFLKAEARVAFAGALHAADSLWINVPERDAIADLKPLQLKAATEVGLRVPETLITNDPQSARTFVCRHPQGCIYKRLSGAPLLDEAGRLTAAITVEITPPIAERLQSVAVIRDAIARTLVAGRTARVGKTAAAPLD